VFLGTHPLRLDEKGRLFLPAKWRSQMAAGLVVTRGQERCLFVFTEEAFLALSQEPQANALTDRGSRNYGRMLFAGAYDQIPDKQGRITVPTLLREYASLDREAVVIGAGSRVEIWDAAAWNALVEETEESYAGLDEGRTPAG
jgi:MraZ protein